LVAGSRPAATFIGILVHWDLVGTLPRPLGVAGHEGSAVIVGLNVLRLPTVWPGTTRRAFTNGRPPRSASGRAQTGSIAPALALVQNKASRPRGGP
jgi:hypothetical protein